MPSRCEAVYWVNTSSTIKQVFLPTELCRDGKIPVKNLNGMNEDIMLIWIETKSIPAKEYDIVKSDKPRENTEARI